MSDQNKVIETGTVKSRRGRRALALVLAMLVVLLGLSSFLLYRLIAPAKNIASGANSIGEADPNGGVTWVSSLYGMSNTPADQLSRTQAAVPAPDGSMWVTDSIHRSLMHFTSDGRFISQIKGPADLPLDAPSRMAIGPDGLLYVAETSAGAIRVLRTNNTDAGSFGVPQPLSVAVSSDRIVVGSVAGFAILDKKGEPLHVIGTRGKGDKQFDYVHGVAIGKDGTIYVVDSYNNRLSAYDKDGKRLWIVRTGNPSNGAQMVKGSLTTTKSADMTVTVDAEKSLQLPLGLTIDGAGRLVVADMFDCTLGVFDSKNGEFIGKFGQAGAEDGQFFYPVSVAYDPGRDWFTVADSLSDRIEVVRIPGSAANGVTGLAASAVNRTLAGPMRAFVLPAALLLLAAFAAMIVPIVRKRRSKRVSAAAAIGTPVAVSDDDETFGA